jgi:hypothetical protein
LSEAAFANVALADLYFSLGQAGHVCASFLENFSLTSVRHLFSPHSLLFLTGEHVHTLSDDWKSANKEFMKFQKMNPVHGISKGL